MVCYRYASLQVNDLFPGYTKCRSAILHSRERLQGNDLRRDWQQGFQQFCRVDFFLQSRVHPNRAFRFSQKDLLPGVSDHGPDSSFGGNGHDQIRKSRWRIRQPLVNGMERGEKYCVECHHLSRHCEMEYIQNLASEVTDTRRFQSLAEAGFNRS